MSAQFDGANDTLTGSFNATHNPYPSVLGVQARYLDHPVASDSFLQIGASTSSVTGSLQLRTSGTDNNIQGVTTDDSAANTGLSFGPLVLDGLWFGVLLLSISATDHKLYVDARANVDLSTQNRLISVVQHIRFGESLVAGADFTGWAAEGAFWVNSTFSDADIDNFMARLRPSYIQPTKLQGYWPLESDLLNYGLDTGGDLTASGNFSASGGNPIVAEHPVMHNLATLSRLSGRLNARLIGRMG